MKKFLFLDFSNKKSFLWFLVIFIVLVFIVLLIWTFDFYPIAFVNFRPIMAYSYYKNLEIAKKYYNNSVNLSDINNLKILQQAVLQGLIDEFAIDKRIKQEMTASEEKEKINQQIQRLISDSGVVNGLSQRGISVKEAAKYFLPVAIKNEILSGQLLLEGKNLTSWLVGARKDLKVIILLPNAHWTENGVQFD